MRFCMRASRRGRTGSSTRARFVAEVLVHVLHPYDAVVGEAVRPKRYQRAPRPRLVAQVLRRARNGRDEAIAFDAACDLEDGAALGVAARALLRVVLGRGGEDDAHVAR